MRWDETLQNRGPESCRPEKMPLLLSFGIDSGPALGYDYWKPRDPMSLRYQMDAEILGYSF